MSDNFIPKEALDYIKNKNLKVGFSYKDVWNEEHATAFTVAKAMQIDVLSDLKKAVEKAIEDGQSFETFKENIKPTLQQKGWWGKKKMTDPLTGEVIDAQLGSDRRLKVIFNTNARNAYQKGKYDRGMESDLHPYFIYRIGSSAHHRPEHVSWDGLILPKNDPWWDAHYPQKEYGCNCITYAISETRKKKYENKGIRIPATADGSDPGGILRVQTQAPKTTYRNYYNERKGTIERIPNGVAPGFNWSIGKTRRNTPIVNSCIKKTKDKIPEQFEAVAKSLMTNSATKAAHVDFIDKAINRKLDKKYITPVGFFDLKSAKALEKQGIVIGDHNLIMLEAGLVQSAKYSVRHAAAGNAPDMFDWYNLIDYLIDAEIYYDGIGLIFLKKKTESKYMKIAVDISMKNKGHRGVAMLLPKIDTMYELDISTDSDMGMNEFRRITTKLKKIR